MHGGQLRAKNQVSLIACTKIKRRTKSLKDFTKARTVVVASVQATIRLLGIAVVNWDVGVDEVTL
jgi:hypothetical protein